MNDTRRINGLVSAMILAAVVASAYAVSASHMLHAYFALAVLTLAAATSRMKVKLPGVNGNMSVNLPFLLTAIVNLSAAEAIVIAGLSTAIQCWPRKNAKLNRQQMAFNLSMMTFASCMASLIYHAEWLNQMQWNSTTPGLVLATATLFLGQTVPVASIIALSEKKTGAAVWWNLAQLSFPYYVVSAGVTSMLETVGSHLGWGLALAVFPVMYGIHRSYKLYFGAREAEVPQMQVLVRAAGAGA
ncbi:MAG TPA: hypothetical protein VMX38_04880 [Verrucomicrobiae bacterium]|jgi:hypothetical protein|nr:hypothetical protein [Verrucomicrobiae bacterium]